MSLYEDYGKAKTLGEWFIVILGVLTLGSCNAASSKCQCVGEVDVTFRDVPFPKSLEEAKKVCRSWLSILEWQGKGIGQLHDLWTQDYVIDIRNRREKKSRFFEVYQSANEDVMRCGRRVVFHMEDVLFFWKQKNSKYQDSLIGEYKRARMLIKFAEINLVTYQILYLHVLVHGLDDALPMDEEMMTKLKHWKQYQNEFKNLVDVFKNIASEVPKKDENKDLVDGVTGLEQNVQKYIGTIKDKLSSYEASRGTPQVPGN